MKKLLVIVGIVSLILVGCGASTTQAEEQSIFTYLGQTSKIGSALYKYEDKESGKIVYVIESKVNGGGRALAVVDK